MSTSCTYIHKDKGDNNKNKTLRYSLDGSVNTVYPFLILPKRPMGCQYMNAHNTTISYNILIATTIYKLEMHHKFSTAHCIQVNQHKKKTAKNNYESDVL